jgi:hypothetical protein
VHACNDPGCPNSGTHLVVISIPGSASQVYDLCRKHDGIAKYNVVHSRQKKPPDAQGAGKPNIVRCGECHRLLAEPSDADPALRDPCPDCGSTRRLIEVYLEGELSFHSMVAVKKKSGSSGKWTVKSESGDDYTADLAAWGERDLVVDSENNRYFERIILRDGTEITSRAKLSDHQ